MGTFDAGETGSWAQEGPFDSGEFPPGERIDQQIKVLIDKVERGRRRQDDTQADVISLTGRIETAQKMLAQFDAMHDADISAINGRVAEGLSDLLKLIEQETRTRTEINNALIDRVIRLEGGTVPPVDPPAARKGIYIEGGRLMLEGKVLRQSSTNIAGYGLKSPKDEALKFLDKLQSLGIRIVRFLHPARDVPDGIDDFKPTWAECLLGYDTDINFWMDALAARGMFAHLTCFHRQRLTVAEADALKTPGLKAFLFGPRPSGIVPGEIADTFFVFPELYEIVRDKYCAEIAKRYAKHPALGMVDLSNERMMTRARGFYPAGERPGTQRTDHTAYGLSWFDRLDEYQKQFGYTDPATRDKLMTSARLVHFAIWQGRRVFRGLKNSLRAAGVTCPIGTSAAYGHQRIASLAEMAVGDYVDVHRYPEDDIEPDPFNTPDPLTQPSFGSYLASYSLADVPLICSEWGSVYQSGLKKQQKSPGFGTDPVRVTRAAWVAGAQVLFQYAGAFGPMKKVPAGAPMEFSQTCYDGFGDPAFVKSFTDAQMVNPPISPDVEDVVLSWDDLCGTEIAGKISPPSVIGTQGWAMKAAATGKRVRIRLPEFPEGF